MVPYSGGTTQVLNDMMGGRIALTFDSYSGIAGAVEAGNVHPLAVASPKRVALFPDLPTAAETLPGFEAGGWQVLLAPLGTPEAVVQKANVDLNKAISDPDVIERLGRLGREAHPMSPQETQAFIQTEQQKWAPILVQLGAAHLSQPFSSQAQARTTHSRPPNSEQRRIEVFSARPRWRLYGPAKTATRVLGVDRDCRAALAHVADQLAGAAGALLDRRGAGLGDIAEIKAVAVGAADADREGAGRFGGADHGDQEARQRQSRARE